jgi:hypothetical protein
MVYFLLDFLGETSSAAKKFHFDRDKPVPLFENKIHLPHALAAELDALVR